MKRIILLVAALLACLIGYVSPGAADAILTTANRCTTHFVATGPLDAYNVTICWQWGYRAQGDGTGVYDETLWWDITQNCDNLNEPYLYNMKVTLKNPKTGVVNGVQNLSDGTSCAGSKNLELQGRDVGDETAQWDLTVNLGGFLVDNWKTQFNDCLSLGRSYAGPCDAR